MSSKISFTLPGLDRMETAKNGVIGLFRFSEKRPLVGMAGKVDWRMGGQLSRLIIDDFFSGSSLETLLFPLGRRLFNARLLIIGLGRSDDFDRTLFDNALTHFFETVRGIQCVPSALALPGRPEDRIEAGAAIEWCLDYFDRHSIEDSVTIIEPAGSQQIMAPVVERWRMKHSVTTPEPRFYN